MPDTRENGTLDSRIRELVARAVADAPRPPDIDPSVLPESEPKRDHHRGWWLGGGAAILAAAAVISALLLVGNADDKVSTPGTPPTVAPTPAPTAPATTPATSPPSGPTTVPPAADDADAFVTAGPDGVVEHRGGVTRNLTTEPMAYALATGDGRVVVQRTIGSMADQTGNDAATVPLVLANGRLTELFGDVSTWGGAVRLHDIEVVGGRRLLLYSVITLPPGGSTRETLYVTGLDALASTRIAVTGGDGFFTNRLHLASTGLIVGERSDGIELRAVPGSPAAAGELPTAAELGLDNLAFGCQTCPRAFTVSSDGRTLAWIDPVEDVLMGRRLDDAAADPVQIVDVPGYSTWFDVDLGGPGAVLWHPSGEVSGVSNVLVRAGGATAEIEGSTATFGPGSTDPVAQPVAPSAGAAVLTAGPQGVVRHAEGSSRTLTTSPTAIALDAGDGTVVVQRRRGEGSWTDSDTFPQVLADDGTIEPLLEQAEWSGWIALHDIEFVEGRQLLLYSVFAGDPPRPGTLYVIDLNTAARQEVGPIDPSSRLHLATTGLIVGTARLQLSHSIVIEAVPGSPAADAGLPTPADLHLEEEYFDCLDCPNSFTVTPDGETIAWADDGELVALSLSPAIGEPRVLATVPASESAGDDLDLGSAAALLSFAGDGPQASPVSVPLDGSDHATLEGATATFAPAGSGQPGPVESEPPVLTAGPEGVVEHHGGESTTLTTEPMVIALDAGDGRIIVQRRSGNGEGAGWTDADTIPQVLADDGTTRPLFGAAVWEGGIVLHDIEVVDGHRLLLYSVQRQYLDPQQANENLFVVDLNTEEGTRVARNIGGWEFGTDRLHLATTGLIVGEQSAEASHGIAIYAVPGSPAAAAALPTAADLGLEDSYGDCSDCPRSFTVTPDGQTIAWVDSTRGLVAVSLGPPFGEPEVLVGVSRAGAVRDLDVGDAAAVVSFFSDPAVPPRLVELDGSDVVSLTGTTATFGPAG